PLIVLGWGCSSASGSHGSSASASSASAGLIPAGFYDDHQEGLSLHITDSGAAQRFELGHGPQCSGTVDAWLGDPTMPQLNSEVRDPDLPMCDSPILVSVMDNGNTIGLLTSGTFDWFYRRDFGAFVGTYTLDKGGSGELTILVADEDGVDVSIAPDC